jgi:uncharacterized glyoxalase superfamily protein PhnB
MPVLCSIVVSDAPFDGFVHARRLIMQAPTAAPISNVTMYPIIGYRDLGAAIEWLCRVFGCEPLEVMKNDDGTYAHVELRLGEGVIMPTSFDKSGDPANPWNQPLTTQGLYVALNGVDAHYARAVAAGVEIARPLAERRLRLARVHGQGFGSEPLELRHVPTEDGLTLVRIAPAWESLHGWRVRLIFNHPTGRRGRS